MQFLAVSAQRQSKKFPYPPEIAAEEIQNHVNKYWEPFLRKKLFEIYACDESTFKTAIKKAIS